MRKRAHSQTISDPIESATSAGLRYSTDAQPGIRRLRRGAGFHYVGPNGQPIHDEQTLQRIRALAIPPAWTDIWICPTSTGHLQATGRDAKGRKQYRYHPRWREARDETKYDKMIAFGQALPGIRRQVEKDLALPGLPREKVLAAIVRLLETTLIRVGNEEYVRQNGSFGLTTLRDDHLKVHGSKARLVFRGKSGIKHSVELMDRRLARIVKRCRDLPGEELFQYVDDDGQVHGVTSSDVNEYVRSIAGEEFTAKDFRTWAGTVLAICALDELPAFKTKTQAKQNVVRAVETVAKRLGNTKAVCRKCYIHPAVVEAYLEGKLFRVANQGPTKSPAELRPEEAAVLAFLSGCS